MGSAKFVTTGARGRLRTCKRCEAEAQHNQICVEIAIQGSMIHKSYCLTCFGTILDATQRKLDALRADLTARVAQAP